MRKQYSTCVVKSSWLLAYKCRHQNVHKLCVVKTYFLQNAFSKLYPASSNKSTDCDDVFVFHFVAISAKASPLETNSGPCFRYGSSSPRQIFCSTNASIPTTAAMVTKTKTSTNTMACLGFIPFRIVRNLFIIISNWFSVSSRDVFVDWRCFEVLRLEVSHFLRHLQVLI